MQMGIPLKTTHTIRVRFNETDALGIVWHGNYIKYFEDGREAFGREFNISYLDIKKQGYATPIVSTETNHKLPLQFGDIAFVETTFVNHRAAKLVFKYSIKNENGSVVCTGETTQVFTNLKTGEMSFTLPEFFKNWKLKHKLINA